MQIETHDDADAVARAAARFVADRARQCIAARGRFVFAVSGGTTPWQMLRLLAKEPDVPWEAVHMVQVDERVAPGGHDDRNLTHLRASLLPGAPLPEGNLHPMPVEASDLPAAAAAYGQLLETLAGQPPAIDLMHLGLGPDGHTASLVPGDPVLEVMDADVALTGVYQGRRRMTLTYPALNRAREVLWLATGVSKAEMLARLIAGDRSIPAGVVEQLRATVLADGAAAAKLKPGVITQ